MREIRRKFNGGTFAKALQENPVAMKSLWRLSGNGTRAARDISALVAHCSCKEIFEHRKQELDEIKVDLTKLAVALRKCAEDMDRVKGKKFRILGKTPLGENVTGFKEMASSLREGATYFEKQRDGIVEENSLRTITPSLHLYLLYSYCRGISKLNHVPYGDLANILAVGAQVYDIESSDSDAIRKAIKRFEREPKMAEQRALIQTAIRIYMEPPQPEVLFADFVASL